MSYFYFIRSDTLSNIKIKHEAQRKNFIRGYLIVNGRAAAQQNHLGTDESDEEVLMDGSPVRFGDAMRKIKRGVCITARQFTL